jgi:Peptidase family M28
MNDLKPLTAAIVTFVFVVGIAVAALYDLRPPAPVPASAPDSLFSADRAAGYLREIALEPHPLGSPRNLEVRNYIVQQLAAMDLQPRLDTATVTGSFRGIHYAATVVNIIARLTGTDNSKAVLLMAHYDSVPTGPGASDDGSGVATILETLRALKFSSPLKNDVIAIFTDGEEVGMMGAQAVVEDTSLLNQAGIALNFEARGTSGPSMMFETSDGNGWLIKQLAEAAPDPVATSLAYDAYRNLPNNTDFSWLKAMGVAGMNFAFIGDLERYHSETDNYSNIDERSIQHDGSYALELTKHFGDLHLPAPKSANYIYFNFFWPGFVYYPASFVPVVSAVAAVFFLLMAYIGIKRTTIKLTKSAIALLLPLLPTMILGGGTFFLWKAVQNSYPESSHFLFGTFYGNGVFLSALILVATALTSAYYILLRRFFRSSEMAVGSLFWWVILAAVSSYYLPHGAYVFQWPAIFSSLALLLFFLASKSDFRSPIMMLVLLVCAVPGIYLVTQIVYLIYMTALEPAVVTAIVAVVILTVGTLLPHVAIISAPKKWAFPIAIFVIALAVGTLGVLTHHLGAHHPKSDSIDYALDLDNSKAYWVSLDDSTDEWTSQFMPQRVDSVPAFIPGGCRLAAKSSPIAIAPVSAVLLSDSSYRGAQILKLLVKSPEAGSPIRLSTETQVLAASVEGHPVPDSVAIFPSGKQSRWMLYYYGLPDSGATLTLVIPAGQQLRLTTVETVAGLPEVGGLPSYPRPSSIMRRPFVTTDAAIVKKSYVF